MKTTACVVFSVSLIPGKSINRRLATVGAAMSFPPYSVFDGNSLISEFIRYWIVNILIFSDPYIAIIRSNNVVSRGLIFPLTADLTVGGNCKWSPAKITFFAFNKGIQLCASNAWLASSIITTSQFRPSNSLPPDPCNVAKWTLAVRITSSTHFLSRVRTSLRNSLTWL